MKYYRTHATTDSTDSQPHLVARRGDTAYDLTAANNDLQKFADLTEAAAIAETDIDEIAETHCHSETEVSLDAVRESCSVPVIAEEVWAAGVTYQISEEARETESTLPEMYRAVYDAERPEIFFKSTPSRTVGPGEDIGIRGDSDWNVPEPELGIVLYRGDIVGYTAGNDVSSRDIEGENPLYLPQAKVYDRCCALGPCVSSPGTVEDPHDLDFSMRIERDGETVYEDETSTAQLARTVEELVSYLTRHNVLPELTVLLTGTSLVPEDEFTLEVGDTVTIDIEGIGTLENSVRNV
jgi:2-dehydro-3-deoxy-D-arabinonate dehydratase